MNHWRCIRKVFICIAVLSVLGVFLVPTTRADVTLTDENSTVTIDPSTSQAGVNAWNVDGVNQLYQQWFWYRIGSTGGQSSIDTISPPVVNLIAPEQVDITYANNQLRVQIEYDLTGGSPGSGTADLSEIVRITNLSGAPLSLHFFQYSDFDLGGNFDGDSVTLTRNLALQTKPGIELSESVVTPGASRLEADLFPNTLLNLNNTAGYNLNNVAAAGPGDVTWAYQWDRVLGVDGTYIISKDKHLEAIPIPEPSTLAIAGLAGLGLIGYGYRRTRKG